MKYVYPAVVYPDEKYICISVPDLPGCFTYGKDMAEALDMGKDALEMWLWSAENEKLPIPQASKTLPTKDGETLTLILADTDAWRRENDKRSVKKTLTVPAWLNNQAEKANAPFSQILQQGLKEYLKIA